MGSKRKLRAYCTVNGIERELVSIRELSDGSLTIMVAPSDNAVLSDGRLLPYDQEHYSVHRSNEGADTTLIRKTRFATGNRISAVAFLKGTSKRLVWVIHVERVHLIQNFVPFHARPKDTKLHICSYNQDRCMLLYCIIVANSDYLMPDAEFEFIRYAELLTKEYKITIGYTFFHYPAMPIGFARANMTSDAIFDDVPNIDHKQIETSQSVPDAIFHKFILAMFQSAMHDWRKRLTSDYGVPAAQAEEMLLTRRLYSFPLM